MKLLFVMFDGPNFSGGPAINLTRLLPELIRRGHDVNLLCFHYGNEHPNADIIERNNGHCIYHKVNLNSKTIVPWILEVCKNITPDVFIPDVSTQGLLAGRWIKNSGVPVVNTMRGNDRLNWGKAIFFSRKSKWQTSAIVFVNDYLKVELNKEVKTSIKQIVIPSGVEMSNFYSNHNQEKIGFVYSGRLTTRIKNVDKIIDSFIKIAQKHPNTFFNLIGSGEEKERIQSKINLSELSDRIKIVSPLKGEKYKEFLAEHNFILLMSDSEGTPGSIMDGMSCGLIPLLSYYKGVENIVKHNVNGAIIKEESVLDTVDEIIFDIEKRKKFSENAMAHIEEKFSLDYCANQWEYLFSEIMMNKTNNIVIPRGIKLPRKSSLLLEHDIELTYFDKLERLFFKALKKVKL
jgi:glycosyltransferase involved in cell wall biosynthesis